MDVMCYIFMHVLPISTRFENNEAVSPPDWSVALETNTPDL